MLKRKREWIKKRFFVENSRKKSHELINIGGAHYPHIQTWTLEAWISQRVEDKQTVLLMEVTVAEQKRENEKYNDELERVEKKQHLRCLKSHNSFHSLASKESEVMSSEWMRITKIQNILFIQCYCLSQTWWNLMQWTQRDDFSSPTAYSENEFKPRLETEMTDKRRRIKLKGCLRRTEMWPDETIERNWSDEIRRVWRMKCKHKTIYLFITYSYTLSLSLSLPRTTHKIVPKILFRLVLSPSTSVDWVLWMCVPVIFDQTENTNETIFIFAPVNFISRLRINAQTMKRKGWWRAMGQRHGREAVGDERFF